uniref:uncharacterized protein LOC124017889 isoform X1 n=1 Tax=Oncorhynchus gorbuscha TaxID=8017 RepID=UPI001EAF72CF|nr:uncharacterized protein LOC124017889 isoform X1 [Oncorhynchus gorbuscha]
MEKETVQAFNPCRSPDRIQMEGLRKTPVDEQQDEDEASGADMEDDPMDHDDLTGHDDYTPLLPMSSQGPSQPVKPKTTSSLVKLTEDEVHHSIVPVNSLLSLTRCTTCCKLFHCPLCLSFKPTKRSRLQRHVDVHLKNAVSFKDKKICKCNLDCRTDGHYHCPQCERTIIRRDAMTSHLLLCQGASAPVSSAVLPTPAVNQRIQITTHIQLPHSPAYRTLTTMCDHCGFVLLRKNLKQHLLRKHPEIATPLEGAQSDPVSVAQQHGTMKHAEGTRRRRRLTATCTICGRPVTMKNMRAHMNRKHPDSW